MKLVWIVQAFKQQDPMGNLQDVCTLELYGKSAKDVLKRAKKLIKKDHYRVSQVIEKEE